MMRTSVVEKVFLTMTIAFGLLGSGVGLYDSICNLIADVKLNPNPFAGLFHFG
jgi:hypothetical protein